MLYFIIAILIVFVFVLILLNWQKIKAMLKPKIKESKKQKADADKTISNENFSHSEKDTPLYTDNLNKGEPYIVATEAELNELSNPTESSGRIHSDKEPAEELEVKVEDLGNYDEDAYFDDDQEFYAQEVFDLDVVENDIADQIKNLSPEMKALLLTSALNKKEDI